MGIAVLFVYMGMGKEKRCASGGGRGGVVVSRDCCPLCLHHGEEAERVQCWDIFSGHCCPVCLHRNGDEEKGQYWDIIIQWALSVAPISSMLNKSFQPCGALS